ncbi:MAG: fibronectin type III domain-containing protein [Casimicrobiaceae bacterium]
MLSRTLTGLLGALAAVLVTSPPAGYAAPISLDSFNVAPGGTTVSGISSGGYMANQFHVAFSSVVRGAGILAAGPFYCAKGNVATALTDCTTPTALNTPDVGYSIRVTDDYAARAEIDRPSYLYDSRVWIFSGTKDVTVYPVVVDRLYEYYRNYVNYANITYVNTVPAAHSMVTDDYGHACDHAGDGNNPDDVFINDCDYSAAGKLLEHLYGRLRAPASTLTGTVVEFDQAEFLPDPVSHSMNVTGYAYVPAACDDGAVCRVHVAFHGCRQQPARIGDKFYRHAGYNKWADTNKIIVLYPQTINSDLPPVYNPRGCWDWWGYDDPNYAKQSGRQMRAVKTMIDRVAAGYNAAPPQAPASLAATAPSDHELSLQWMPSRGPRLATYNVYYATSPEGSYARAGTTGEPRARITGLLSGTTYYFAVRAENRRNVESGSSNIFQITTSGLPALPGALTPLVALIP